MTRPSSIRPRATRSEAPAAHRPGRAHVVLDLMIIGLAITLEPITIVAFILILGTEKAPGKGSPSYSAGRPPW